MSKALELARGERLCPRCNFGTLEGDLAHCRACVDPVGFSNWSADAIHDMLSEWHDDTCPICYWRPRLANLASCLRSAAFGQAMFDAGGCYEMYRESIRRRNSALMRWNWHPGCGRALAGWEVSP